MYSFTWGLEWKRSSHFPRNNMSNLNYPSCRDLLVQSCSWCGMVWYRTFRVKITKLNILRQGSFDASFPASNRYLMQGRTKWGALHTCGCGKLSISVTWRDETITICLAVTIVRFSATWSSLNYIQVVFKIRCKGKAKYHLIGVRVVSYLPAGSRTTRMIGIESTFFISTEHRCNSEARCLPLFESEDKRGSYVIHKYALCNGSKDES